MSTLSALPPAPPLPLSPEPHTLASLWERENARRLRWLSLALVAIGLLWRCARYFLCFPVWGDEALLLVNYFTRDFGDLFGPIDNCQIAPLLFHVAALASFRLFGSGELAVRLPSFLACIGSLILFWRLARLTLPPLARTLAVGILAVSIWPATMGSLTKPYAFDLFASLALLLPAVTWFRRPDRVGPLVALVLIVPLAILSSYPAVFIAAAIGVVLLPAVVRHRRPVVTALFACYALLLIGVFAGHYWFVARPHLVSPTEGSITAARMTTYWKAGFPPLEPVALVEWLVFAHTGQVAAYPLGAAKGGSILTFLLGMIGLVVLWRRGQQRLVAIMGVVFGLGLVAAFLHKYPYGASCRLAQHAAPFFCLIAGVGAAVLIERYVEASRRWRATLVVAAILALIGLGGTVRDFLRPYRDLEARWTRTLVDDLAARSGDDSILVLQDAPAVPPIFQWQLGRHAGRVLWADEIDWPSIAQTRSSLWVISYAPPEDERLVVEKHLTQAGRTWRCVERTPSIFCPDLVREPLQFCRVYHWVCSDD